MAEVVAQQVPETLAAHLVMGMHVLAFLAGIHVAVLVSDQGHDVGAVAHPASVPPPCHPLQELLEVHGNLVVEVDLQFATIGTCMQLSLCNSANMCIPGHEPAREDTKIQDLFNWSPIASPVVATCG
jgi:hypothetical protein